MAKRNTYKGISKEEGRFLAKQKAGMIDEYDDKEEMDKSPRTSVHTGRKVKVRPDRAGHYTEKKRAGVEVEPGTFKKPKGTQFVEIVMATPKKAPKAKSVAEERMRRKRRR